MGKEEMKKNAKKLNALLLCAAELVIGVLLLIKPVAFTAGVIICCGAAMMMKGLFSVISYFKAPAPEAAKNQSLSHGLMYLLAGAFCAFGYRWLMAAVPFLGVVYAVLLVWLGIQKIQTTVDQLRLGNTRWYLMGISAALSLLFAAVIFLNPFAAAEGLWIFAGIALIVEAVADIVSFVTNHTKDGCSASHGG